ncbi:hypothetical protein pb186bvf_014903 [Paramecium bursaria]
MTRQLQLLPPQNNGSNDQPSKVGYYFSKIKSYLYGETEGKSQDQELDKLKKDVQELQTNFKYFQNQRQQTQTILQEIDLIKDKQGYQYQLLCHQMDNLQQNFKNPKTQYQNDLDDSIIIQKFDHNDLKQQEDKLLKIINQSCLNLEQNFQQKITFLNEQISEINNQIIDHNNKYLQQNIGKEVESQIEQLISKYDNLSKQIYQIEQTNGLQKPFNQSTKKLQQSTKQQQQTQYKDLNKSLMKSTKSNMFQSCYQERDQIELGNLEFSVTSLKPQETVLLLFQPGHFNIPIIVTDLRDQILNKIEDIAKGWITKEIEPEFKDFIGSIQPLDSNYLENQRQYDGKILKQYQHVRGDGNCFYTTLMYQILSQNIIDLDFIDQEIHELHYYLPDDPQKYSFNEKETQELIYMLKEKLASVDIKELYQFSKYQYYVILTVISRNLVYKQLQKDTESLEIFKLLVDDYDRELLEWGRMCNSNEVIISTICKTMNIKVEIITISEGFNQNQIYKAEKDELINHYSLLNTEKSKSILKMDKFNQQFNDKLNYRIIQTSTYTQDVKYLAIGLVLIKNQQEVKDYLQQQNLENLIKFNYQQIDELTQEDFKSIIDDVKQLLRILFSQYNLENYNLSLESLVSIVLKKIKMGITIYSFDKKQMSQLNSKQQCQQSLIIKEHTIAIVE